MNKKIIVLAAVLNLLAPINGFSEEAPRKVFELAANSLILYGRDPLIVAVVKGQNKKNIPIQEIKKMDEAWIKFSGVSEQMKALMTSEAADYLNGIQKSKPYFAEIFLMDNKGAIVAMTHKTSDYWQGDEAKFQKTFNAGDGTLFVDETSFDQSTQTQLAQVSVPVMDQGKAIGVITFGIEVKKVEDETPRRSSNSYSEVDREKVERYIAELAEQGIRPTEIARRLEAAKLPPPGGYPYWHSIMVKRILRNLAQSR